jgi:UPF0755 protein
MFYLMKHRLTYWLIGFLGLVMIGFYVILWMPNTFDGDRIVIVSKGENFQQVTDSLQSAGVLRSRLLFDIAGRILGSTTKLQIGKYRFKSGASNLSILDNIQNGRTVETITVTIREGLRATTQAKIFAKELGIDSARFMELVNDSGFAHQLGVPSDNLMGYLMPKKYKFYWQTDETEIIKELVKEFWIEFDNKMLAQAGRRKMTINQILTMASIIELETAIDTERAVVAGVYYNRLQRRMRLQADPTIQFILSGEPRRLHYSDLRVESAYNTYKNYGLPPGPINNPGKASMLAALYPSRHKYLYFVASGVGGHIFTKDFESHKRAIQQYRKTREEQKAMKESDG